MNEVFNKITEIKEKVGQDAESIIASGLNLEQKGKKYRCPNHYAHNNGDKNPSMSWDPNRLQFKCFGCDHRIDIYSYYKDHLNYTYTEIVNDILKEEVHFNTRVYKNRDKFKSQIATVTDLNDDCRHYLNLRGVTDDTLKKFSIRTYKGAIAFPYYKYESIVGYKTRKPLKNPGNPKMMSIGGSKPYLFGVQNIDLENKELIICEGEIDCMIISQSGMTNVVSVGAGANSMATLIDQAKDFLNQFEMLIVVSDADDAGAKMDKELSEAFEGKVKLIDKKLYGQKANGKYNDINDEHFLNGPKKILEIIDSARLKIQGRRDLDKTPYKGIKQFSGLKYIPTGLDSIDNMLNDLGPGDLTILSGEASAGKTLFMRQIIVNAIDKMNKIYWINGENQPEMLLNELYRTLVSGVDELYELFDVIQINKMKMYEPKQETLELLQEWHKEKLFLFNRGEAGRLTTDELLNMLEMEIKFNNHNLIIVDNLMSVLRTDATNKNQQEKDFVDRLQTLAKNYKTHIILVVHPNKTFQRTEQAHFSQISGSSDMYNLADNIMWIYRYYDEEKIDQGIHGAIEVQKNRMYGLVGKVNTHFQSSSKRLIEIDELGRVINKRYGRWEKMLADGKDKTKKILNDPALPF